MNRDDDDRFQPRYGKIRNDQLGKEPTKSFLTQVRKSTSRQAWAVRPPKARVGQGKRNRRDTLSARGVRRGRGAAFVRARELTANGWSHRQPGTRRVVVKMRSVRGHRLAAAHLRYIQRDGTARDGTRGQLYSADADRAEASGFLDRGRDDRHHFRLIVSPEDATELADLNAFTRDLMRQVEQDLCTRLDWVAVNHFNTGHPHVHIVVNGRDDLGEDLVINGGYIAQGFRERASELVTLELGIVSEREQQQKLITEIEQDRFTRIDRMLIADSEEARVIGSGLIDLRHEPGDKSATFERTLRLRRLAKLENMKLATERAPGCWELSPRLEKTLRDLGERGDIVRTMQKALRAEGQERDPMTLVVHETAPKQPVTGKLIDMYLSDELGENLTLIVDGIDGFTHRIANVDPAETHGNLKLGAIVELGPATDLRPADRTILEQAADGFYVPSRHLAEASLQEQLPGGNPEAYVEAHVRRLEALRRTGIVERIDRDCWRIPEGFEQQVIAYDARRNRQANLRILSAFDLERQIGSDGATWLDRRLLGRGQGDLSSGFGEEVGKALDKRRERLIERGDATRKPDGRVFYRGNLLATLKERELVRRGGELAATKSLPFRATESGDTIRGTFTETVQLASGKYALVENAHEFTLVPWRPVIETHLGHEVAGVMHGDNVSWQLGRSRGLGL